MYDITTDKRGWQLAIGDELTVAVPHAEPTASVFMRRQMRMASASRPASEDYCLGVKLNDTYVYFYRTHFTVSPQRLTLGTIQGRLRGGFMTRLVPEVRLPGEATVVHHLQPDVWLTVRAWRFTPRFSAVVYDPTKGVRVP